MGTEWGPGGEPMGRNEHQLAPNSRSSDASRSEASSAANAFKPVAANGGMVAATPPGDNATIKKKRSKFLAKQFEVLTRSTTSAASAPRRNVKLLGQDYIIAVPGSRVATSAIPDPDLNREDRAVNASAEPSTGSATPPVDQKVNVEKPPIEFVTAPIDYKIEHRREVVRGELPLDYISERSPRMSPRVAALSTRALPALSARVYASMSRSHSSVGRSLSGSERFSAGTPRSERSVLSVPETVISSAVEHHGRHASLKTESRTSHSSLAEWSCHSLDRRGELSIAGLSLGEGRNISGISRRTDLTSGQSPARDDTQALDYSPDDTDSGVEMYHETTSASPGSYSSRRTSCNISEGWMPEFEESDGVSHHYRRSKHRGSNNNDNINHRSRSPSYSAYSRSLSVSSARCSPPTANQIRSQYSPNTLRKIFTRELNLDPPSHGKMRHRDSDYYDGHKHSNLANSSNHSSRRHHANPKKRGDDGGSNASSKVVVLLGKYGRRKRAPRGRVEIDDDGDSAIALDSMTPEEAIAVFHDEVARMLVEEGHECGEAADVEEFLDGYMRLRSPFYVAMIDDFFRAVCVDCYKRPVELPVDGRSVASSKSLRFDSHLHHFRDFNTRM